MSRRSPRFAAPLLALTMALGACGDDEDTATTTTSAGEATTTTTAASETTTTAPPEPTEPDGTVVEVDVAGGGPVGGVRTVEVPLGETVTLRVSGDVDDEFHLHGYDLLQAVGGEIVFVADIPGQFEVELEGSHTLILELVVA